MSTLQLSHEDLQVLPPLVNVPTAAAALGISRSTAYELIRTGGWPTPVLHLGTVIRIPSRDLKKLIGLEP